MIRPKPCFQVRFFLFVENTQWLFESCCCSTLPRPYVAADRKTIGDGQQPKSHFRVCQYTIHPVSAAFWLTNSTNLIFIPFHFPQIFINLPPSIWVPVFIFNRSRSKYCAIWQPRNVILQMADQIANLTVFRAQFAPRPVFPESRIPRVLEL